MQHVFFIIIIVNTRTQSGSLYIYNLPLHKPWQKSKHCQKQNRTRKISCPVCLQTCHISHFPAALPRDLPGSWPPLRAADRAPLNYSAEWHWCQPWPLWEMKWQSHTMLIIYPKSSLKNCSADSAHAVWCLTLRYPSPSSSFSSLFPVFPGTKHLI